MVAQVSKTNAETATAGFEAVLDLRHLHVELDHTVRDAYGWRDLDLGHGFQNIEFLPENDRARYTISPSARRKMLSRLFAENHDRAISAPAAPRLRRRRPVRETATTGSDLFVSTRSEATQ